MSISDFLELAEEIKRLQSQNTGLLQMAELYKKQLVLVGVSNGGRMTDIPCEDLTLIDWDKVSISIGCVSFSVFDETTRAFIKSYAELPLLKIDNA